jgi:hypothetical protein
MEHVAALRSAEANEFAAKQVPDLRTRLERQQAATLRAKEALAAEEQKCKELQAQLDAQSPATGWEALEKEKQAMSEEKQALAKEKHALTERDAALRAAMKDFDVKVDARPAREVVMEEKKREGEVGDKEVLEELKNAPVKVKPFDSTATNRKQIDEQQAVLTNLFHVFENVNVEGCKFKITHVARNMLALENINDEQSVMNFAVTMRRRLGKLLNISDKGIRNESFDNIISAVVGCSAIPMFNGYLEKLRKMGIATDNIALIAFGQHCRQISSSKEATYAAIRGIDHNPVRRAKMKKPICVHILSNGISQCPMKAKKNSVFCSRHSATKRQRSD